jgi:hypothetical protein
VDGGADTNHPDITALLLKYSDNMNGAWVASKFYPEKFTDVQKEYINGFFRTAGFSKEEITQIFKDNTTF